MDVIYHFKEEREKQRLSIGSLSRISGVSKSYISEVESGKYHPTVFFTCQIAVALQISPYTLFELETS